jgi:hypothetical protein
MLRALVAGSRFEIRGHAMMDVDADEFRPSRFFFARALEFWLTAASVTLSAFLAPSPLVGKFHVTARGNWRCDPR